MAPDELGDLRARVERLEREVERLRALVPPGAKIDVQPGPPPYVQRPPVRQPIFEKVEQKPIHDEPVRQPRTQAPVPPKEKVDAEFKFGSYVLPRVGIGLLLLGLLILVAIAIQRGIITLSVQFGGEIALCAALIGVGILKLNEREDFGQVLVGGGSCGLYLSFAGAYAYKNLISGETLVLLFVLLSLANLGFSWWRSSKTFWCIGFLGGFVAASLPLDKGDATAALVLAGLIATPAVILAGKRQWLKAIGGLWLVSLAFVQFVTLTAIHDKRMDIGSAIAATLVFALVPIAVHAWRFVASEFDRQNWFGATAVAVTGLSVFSYGSSPDPIPHSVALILWGLAVFASVMPLIDKPHGRIVAVSGFITAAVLAPAAFTPLAASMTYFGLGIAASISAHTRRKETEQLSIVLSAGFVALTLVAYAYAMSFATVQSQDELLMLGFVGLGIANVALLASRLEGKHADAITVGAMLLYPILARTSYVAGGPLAEYSTLITTSVYALLLAIVGMRAKWQNLSIFAAALTLVTNLALAQVVDSGTESGLTHGREIALLAINLAALALSALGVGRDKVSRDVAYIVGAMLGALSFIPIVALSFGAESAIQPEGPDWIGAILLYAFVLGILAQRSRTKGVGIVGTLVSIAAVMLYLDNVTSSFIQPWAQVLLMSSAIAAIALNAFASADTPGEKQTSWFIAALIAWYPAVRIVSLLLGPDYAGLDVGLVVVAGGALYSLVLGLAAKWQQWVSIAWLGFGVNFVAIVSYWMLASDESLSIIVGQQILCLAIASAALIACSLSAATTESHRQAVNVMAATGGWFVLARMFYLVLGLLGMQSQGALTASWTLYSSVVLALGFVYKDKALRITSLVMFAVTIGKVFLIDLAELDDLIKVIVLVLLGFVLILGGYIYVRMRQSSSANPT